MLHRCEFLIEIVVGKSVPEKTKFNCKKYKVYVAFWVFVLYTLKIAVKKTTQHLVFVCFRFSFSRTVTMNSSCGTRMGTDN